MSLLEGLSDLLFPPRCLGCEAPLGHAGPPLLCPNCLTLLVPLTSPRCDCCGIPFVSEADHLCGDCLKNSFPFDRARSAFLYREPLSTLIAEWKFTGRMTGLDTLVALAADSEARRDLSSADLVVPVPLHLSRLRERGFNQSLILAKQCFPSRRHAVYPNLLIRTRPTIPQTGLSGPARRKNLRRAFLVPKPEEVEGRRILLVDDVFTTGSTVTECCITLRQAGASRIEIFTLARAL